MRKLSVVICTHNPRHEFMERVLNSLRDQTLPRESWELLLIDNRSDVPLSTRYDLSWHPYSRHVREEELGLNAANLRGIKEAKTDTIVFVHDDNVLAPDYLQVALEILGRMPWLGAFNGSTVGEYEVPLPTWASNMPIQLAVREITKAAWGCLPGTQCTPFAPVGAGMVIRKSIADFYAAKVRADKVRDSLGRKGGVLASGEDSDMAYCACELGYAVGVFPELSLIHVMPRQRLERAYFLRLAEGMGFSHAVLGYIWDKRMPEGDTRPCLSVRVFDAYQRLRRRMAGNELAIWREQWQDATDRGIRRAHAVIAEMLDQPSA
jgi:glycosyltransferase involved in cell wall biosynthesis